MDFRLRNIDDQVWKDFKRAALELDIPTNTLLLEVVNEYVGKWRSKEKARLIKKLDDLNQEKLL